MNPKDKLEAAEQEMEIASAMLSVARYLPPLTPKQKELVEALFKRAWAGGKLTALRVAVPNYILPLANRKPLFGHRSSKVTH